VLQDRILLQQETRVRDAGAAFSSTASYAYDRIGQVKAFTWNGQETKFPTDSNGNPVQTSNPEQQKGNRAEQGADPSTLLYDEDGNVVAITYGTGARARQWLLTYDQANHLTLMAYGSGTGEDWKREWVLKFTYDAEGRLVQSQEFFGQNLRPGSVRLYAQDGEQVWADLDSDGQVQVRYWRGDGVDQLFGRQEPQRQDRRTLWYLTDRQNSVIRMMAEGQEAQPAKILRYKDGKVEPRTRKGKVVDRFEYTGRENFYSPWGLFGGLQYNRGRWYAPEVGRWLSEDALGFGAGDTNLYRYVGNSHPNYTDPTGKFLVIPGLIAVAALIFLDAQNVANPDRGTDGKWRSVPTPPDRFATSVGQAASLALLPLKPVMIVSGLAIGTGLDLGLQTVRYVEAPAGKKQPISLGHALEVGSATAWLGPVFQAVPRLGYGATALGLYGSATALADGRPLEALYDLGLAFLPFADRKFRRMVKRDYIRARKYWRDQAAPALGQWFADHPRWNPLNYRFAGGLGSNGGNMRFQYVGPRGQGPSELPVGEAHDAVQYEMLKHRLRVEEGRSRGYRRDQADMFDEEGRVRYFESVDALREYQANMPVRFEQQTTPWQRRAYQRGDIDWDLVRPQGVELAGQTRLYPK